MCIHVYICTCAYVGLCICLCVYVCVSVHECVYVCVYEYKKCMAYAYLGVILCTLLFASDRLRYISFVFIASNSDLYK